MQWKIWINSILLFLNLQFNRTDRAQMGRSFNLYAVLLLSFVSKLENCKAPHATRSVQRGRESDIPFNPLLMELLDRLRYMKPYRKGKHLCLIHEIRIHLRHSKWPLIIQLRKQTSHDISEFLYRGHILPCRPSWT